MSFAAVMIGALKVSKIVGQQQDPENTMAGNTHFKYLRLVRQKLKRGVHAEHYYITRGQ